MDDAERQSIGAVVRTLRSAQGLSRQELVERTADKAEDRVSLEMLAKVEQGRKAPSARTLRKLANGLGVEPQDLAGRAAEWEAALAAGASSAVLRAVTLASGRAGMRAAAASPIGALLSGGAVVGSAVGAGAYLWGRERAERSVLAAQLEARLKQIVESGSEIELARAHEALDAVQADGDGSAAGRGAPEPNDQ
jgi:transcriptional regulator with XRE-family HTH domain